MRSIKYCGVDFAAWCSAEVVESCGHAIEPRVVAVPGKPGAVLLGGEVPPKVLRVRLYWDSLLGLDTAARAKARHEVYAALLSVGGGELVVPGDPEMTYRDAVCTGCGAWSSLFADGCAEVEFACYDPIGYGSQLATESAAFEVGGTWATWPVVSVVAAAGSSVEVADGDSGAYVLVEQAFVGGEKVVVDFQAETCLVDGVDAAAAVSIASEFFSLAPGARELAFSGCSSHSVSWFERWA